MDITNHTLDLERFAKVIATARGSADGAYAARERDAAWARAQTMAGNAGLTLDAALRQLEGNGEPTPEPKPDRRTDPLWEVFREMGERQERAARHPFPETDLERLLRLGMTGHNVAGLGLNSEAVEPAAMEAIRSAIPWPKTIRDAVAEVGVWDRLEKEREKIAPGYRLKDSALLRRFELRDFILQTRAATVEDALVRAQWMLTRDQFECMSEWQRQDDMGLLVADLERMAARVERLTRELRASGRGAEPPIRRRNADKRADVIAILHEAGAETLSLRDIAARAGVSPETVRRVRDEMKGRVQK